MSDHRGGAAGWAMIIAVSWVIACSLAPMVAIQIRDVPEGIRDDLAGEARHRGVSLQSLLRDMIEREARIARNHAFLRSHVPTPTRGRGAAPDTDALIRQEHAERDERMGGDPRHSAP